MNKQFDSLMSQVMKRFEEHDKFEEVRNIIENRESPLQVLDWSSWLAIPNNKKLAELDFDRAMEMFKHDNLMAKRRKPARGKPRKIAPNYALSFTGDSDNATKRGDLVATDFNPDNPDGSGKPIAESGFTISYWVRPDELGNDMFAIGRKGHNNERWTFGISNGQK